MRYCRLQNAAADLRNAISDFYELNDGEFMPSEDELKALREILEMQADLEAMCESGQAWLKCKEAAK